MRISPILSDGMTFDGYIDGNNAEGKHLHPPMTFRYRKWFGEARDNIVNAIADAHKSGDSSTGNALSARAIADKIETWNIMEDEACLPVSGPNVQRLEPNCVDRLFGIIVLCTQAPDSVVNTESNNHPPIDIESRFRSIVDCKTPEEAATKN